MDVQFWLTNVSICRGNLLFCLLPSTSPPPVSSLIRPIYFRAMPFMFLMSTNHIFLFSTLLHTSGIVLAFLLSMGGWHVGQKSGWEIGLCIKF